MAVMSDEDEVDDNDNNNKPALDATVKIDTQDIDLDTVQSNANIQQNISYI